MRYINNDPLLKERRRVLRKNSSREEIILWNHLRTKKTGKKFRRQFSIGPFIVDFYCTELKLVIELDGIHHDYNKEYDKERDFFLSAQGCFILRIPNSLIHLDLQKVLNIIYEHIYLLSEQKLNTSHKV
jgi:very-short-patch-repair endonuclease